MGLPMLPCVHSRANSSRNAARVSSLSASAEAAAAFCASAFAAAAASSVAAAAAWSTARRENSVYAATSPLDWNVSCFYYKISHFSIGNQDS